MSCPNLVFADASEVSISPVSGLFLQANQDATVWGQVTNPGVPSDPSRGGSITFYWQQLGINAPIVALPNQPPYSPGSFNPSVLTAAVAPGGSVSTQIDWRPDQYRIGTANPAKGYLWATANTARLEGTPTCAGNTPAPQQPSGYPSYSIVSPLISIENPTDAPRDRVVEGKHQAPAPVVIGFTIGHGHGRARLTSRAVPIKGLSQDVKHSVSVAPRLEHMLAGPMHGEHPLSKRHASERRVTDFEFELSEAGSQGLLHVDFGRSEQRCLIELNLILLDRHGQGLRIGHLNIGLQSGASDPIWLP
ncbi:MAG TPA: hypothetical protein VE987_05855 [Polyangiaceae bacterium]|nr:hypothetical protein [Polyangiaceae bacterium]